MFGVIPVILETVNIFPLKIGTFENLNLPIPNNPIEHLYEHRCYGERGAVLNFPSSKDQGFGHTQVKYCGDENFYQTILDELASIVKNINSNKYKMMHTLNKFD